MPEYGKTLLFIYVAKDFTFLPVPSGTTAGTPNKGVKMQSAAIEKLKKYIKNIYLETKKKHKDNIFRGHFRSISSDIEDGIAILISDILQNSNHKIFLDPTITINKNKKRTHRPDLLVINQENEVVFMIEIKANMGWCRDAKKVLDKIIENHNLYQQTKNIVCKFSKNENQEQEVAYINPQLFLVSFTDENCTKNNHTANKAYANSINIRQYNLFSGWYDNLTDCEIKDFCTCIAEKN